MGDGIRRCGGCQTWEEYVRLGQEDGVVGK